MNKKTFYLMLRIVGIIAVLLIVYYNVFEKGLIQFIQYIITLIVALF